MNRIALVTGAGSGIGRASALALLAAGWHVVLAGRREDALLDTVAQAGAAGPRTLAVPTDVRDAASVKALFAKTRDTFGRLDFLFNNAGTGTPAMPLEDLTVEQWRNVVDINLTGAFLCTQEAFRIMKDQTPRGGRIVNNGSISAHAPRPFSAPYTATKHAISGLTRTISLDGRKYDIACCQIDVGNAMSELASRMSRGVKQADGSVKTEPMIDVKDVARSVLFMANQPLDVNVYHLMVMATKMPYAGRG
jgi:NADP-dependent 3-hydroxy acid dehydrogenase YdfG